MGMKPFVAIDGAGIVMFFEVRKAVIELACDSWSFRTWETTMEGGHWKAQPRLVRYRDVKSAYSHRLNKGLDDRYHDEHLKWEIRENRAGG
jgi:hypothetical protein